MCMSVIWFLFTVTEETKRISVEVWCNLILSDTRQHFAIVCSNFSIWNSLNTWTVHSFLIQQNGAIKKWNKNSDRRGEEEKLKIATNIYRTNSTKCYPFLLFFLFIVVFFIFFVVVWVLHADDWSVFVSKKSIYDTLVDQKQTRAAFR